MPVISAFFIGSSAASSRPYTRDGGASPGAVAIRPVSEAWPSTIGRPHDGHQAIFLKLLVKGHAADAEFGRRPQAIVVVAAQRFLDACALRLATHLIQRD